MDKKLPGGKKSKRQPKGQMAKKLNAGAGADHLRDQPLERMPKFLLYRQIA